MDKPYINRLIAINDMLNSPFQTIRNEGIRLFYELLMEIVEYKEFADEIKIRIQKREYLIQELKTQYPNQKEKIDKLRENLNISPEELKNFEKTHSNEGNKKFYVLNDQINGTDRLNYNRYADAFAELILNPELPTPVTVGIYGEWGQGKSFLMQKIIEKIKNTKKNNKNSSSNGSKILTVEFNAWTYSSSNHLWAGMITQLYNEVENHIGWKVPWYRFAKAVSKSWRKAISFSVFYGLIGFILGLILNFDEFSDAIENVIKPIGASIIGGSVLASLPILWASLREFTDTLFLSRAKNLQLLASKPDFHDQIGVMADIKDEIDFISTLLNKTSSRLVLFIDDLDRCEPKKALEVLQAVILLLSYKDGLPFAIFLGLEPRFITKAIEENYGQVMAKAGITGYEYLDKIIQLPFVIPRSDLKNIESYIESLLWSSEEEKKIVIESGLSHNFEEVDMTLTEADPEISEATEKLEEQTPVTFSRLERLAIKDSSSNFGYNPRKVKRIMNMLRVAKIITQGSNLEFEKILRWITMIEQWPLHTAWILHEVEDDLQKKQIVPETLITDVFQKVRKHIHSDGMSTLFSIDLDPTLFESFIAIQPEFKVLDILNLLPITFNLNPAIRWDVENYANRVVELQNTKVAQPDNNPA